MQDATKLRSMRRHCRLEFTTIISPFHITELFSTRRKNSSCSDKIINKTSYIPSSIARGKPADYGQEIVKRRFRLTVAWLDFAGKRVLDFGCGNRAQTSEFLSTGSTLVS